MNRALLFKVKGTKTLHQSKSVDSRLQDRAYDILQLRVYSIELIFHMFSFEYQHRTCSQISISIDLMRYTKQLGNIHCFASSFGNKCLV